MANVKITELTALTTPVGTDVLPIVDVLGDVTKKVTVADLNSATSTTTTDGDIIIRSSGSETRLPIGSEGQALLVSSGLPVWGNVAGGYTDPLTTDGDIVIRSGGVTTRLGIGSEGQVLKVSSGLPVWAADAGGDVLLDTTPQLGGDLDVNGYDIVSASGGNVEIAPDTTGSFVIRGNNTDGSITLNCTANTHGVTIQSPPHASAATYTLILPDDTGTSGQVLSTNGTGTLSWLTATQPGDNVSTLTNDSAFITSTVTGDFTVDTDTLYVDSTNNRVGIRTSSPAGELHVSSGGTTRCFIEGSNGRSEIRASNGTLSFFTNQDANVSGANNTIFYRNGANESMRIDSDGNVGIGNTPAVALDVSGEIRASTGILFGTDTATANTLDDYEEGTFTPRFAPSNAGSGMVVGYSSQDGTYTKIGNVVTCKIKLAASSYNNGGTGTLLIDDLPFSASGVSGGAIGFHQNWTSGSKPKYFQISDGVDYLQLYDESTSASTTIAATDLTSTAQINCTITYLTA
jgi:hypothetical protein